MSEHRIGAITPEREFNEEAAAAALKATEKNEHEHAPMPVLTLQVGSPMDYAQHIARAAVEMREQAEPRSRIVQRVIAPPRAQPRPVRRR